MLSINRHFEPDTEPFSLGSCPGVCVAERISCFCEAILDVDNLCKSDLRCCVAKKLFEDNDEVSADQLIIPKNDERCKEGEEEEDDEKEEEESSKERKDKILAKYRIFIEINLVYV